jgi:hypothetical protein
VCRRSRAALCRPIKQARSTRLAAHFTYTMPVHLIKIQDTGKGAKSVAEALETVLRKIESWHHGPITFCIPRFELRHQQMPLR